MAVDLTCVVCLGVLSTASTGYVCSQCGRAFPAKDGVISFSSSKYYYNIIPREPMVEYLSSIQRSGWDRAFYQLQERLPGRKSSGLFNNVLAFHRAGWKFLLPRGPQVRVLDLGFGEPRRRPPSGPNPVPA